MLVCCGFVYDLTFWKGNSRINVRATLLGLMFCRDQFRWISVAYISGDSYFISLIMNLVLTLNVADWQSCLLLFIYYFIPFNPLMSSNTQTPHLRSEGLQKFGCMSFISGYVYWLILDLNQVIVPSSISNIQATDACLPISVLFRDIFVYSS